MTFEWILVYRQPAITRVVRNFPIGGTSRPEGRRGGGKGGYILGLSHKRGGNFLKYPLPGRGKFFMSLNCVKITDPPPPSLGINNEQSLNMKNRLTPKNPKMCDPILVTLLKMRPHYNSQSSHENETPSSGTSSLASYKEVALPPPPGLFTSIRNARATTSRACVPFGKDERYQLVKVMITVIGNRTLCRSVIILVILTNWTPATRSSDFVYHSYD